MEMVRIKTSELSGVALDWAVAKCEGGVNFYFDGITWGFELNGQSKVLSSGWAKSMCFVPSIDWGCAGPIIEREKICICPTGKPSGSLWSATDDFGARTMFGQTPLIAALLCYVADKLGDNVEVPSKLF